MSLRKIETSMDISAPVERVWRILTDFASFPQWSRFVVAISGEMRPGARLAVRLDDGGGAMQFRPTLLACAPYELRWRGVLGASFLFSGEHRLCLETLPGERTRLMHGEVFGGLLVPLLWGRLDTRTRRGFEAFNAALRRHAETARA
jgi:hypothetical protein